MDFSGLGVFDSSLILHGFAFRLTVFEVDLELMQHFCHYRVKPLVLCMSLFLIITNDVLELVDSDFVELVRFFTPDMTLVVDGLNFVVRIPIWISSKRCCVSDIWRHFVEEATKVEKSISFLVQAIWKIDRQVFDDAFFVALLTIFTAIGHSNGRLWPLLMLQLWKTVADIISMTVEDGPDDGTPS